ncbi:MAG: sensor histidine kinase [Candidatus Scalindua sp.]|nr:sensor histidine kinase [Candidatus Scalindua sp.]
MTLIHKNLCRSKNLANFDFNEYIKKLTKDLFPSYKIDAGKIILKINIETIPFGTDTAIFCGLIVNERASNSLKYAFPNDREGEINISLSVLLTTMISNS